MSFSRLVTPILNKHGWGNWFFARFAALGTLWVPHQNVHFTPAVAANTWEHLSIHSTHCVGQFLVKNVENVENVHWGVSRAQPQSSLCCHLPSPPLPENSAQLLGRFLLQPTISNSICTAQSQTHHENEIQQYKMLENILFPRCYTWGFPSPQKWVGYL